MNETNPAKLLGAKGGAKTAKLYGKNHYIQAQKKSVASRLANKKLSTVPLLTSGSK